MGRGERGRACGGGDGGLERAVDEARAVELEVARSVLWRAAMARLACSTRRNRRQARRYAARMEVRTHELRVGGECLLEHQARCGQLADRHQADSDVPEHARISGGSSPARGTASERLPTAPASLQRAEVHDRVERGRVVLDGRAICGVGGSVLALLVQPQCQRKRRCRRRAVACRSLLAPPALLRTHERVCHALAARSCPVCRDGSPRVAAEADGCASPLRR